MEIRNYHHIFCGTADLQADWGYGLSEHIIALNKSGLAGEIGVLYVGLVGTPANRERVKSYLTGQIPFKVIAEADSGWEQVTLDPLLADCKAAQEPFKVLYTHSKGAAFPSRINTSWRRDMTEFLVTHWESAVHHLEDNDATGIYWLIAYQYFAGNFWFANSDYIAKLEPATREDRHKAESWFRQLPPKIFDMFPGHPSIALQRINLVEGKENIMKVVFRCNGRILSYLPNRIYTDELTPGLEVLLKRDHDLSLIDPPSIELLQKAKEAAATAAAAAAIAALPPPSPKPEVVKNASNVKAVKTAASTAEHTEDRGSSNGNGASGESRESTSSSEAVSSSS